MKNSLMLFFFAVVPFLSLRVYASECAAGSIQADVLKRISTPASLPNVVGTVSNVELGLINIVQDDGDPYFQIFYGYHISYVGIGPWVGELDMVGFYRADPVTCEITSGHGESIYRVSL